MTFSWKKTCTFLRNFVFPQKLTVTGGLLEAGKKNLVVKLGVVHVGTLI